VRGSERGEHGGSRGAPTELDPDQRFFGCAKAAPAIFRWHRDPEHAETAQGIPRFRTLLLRFSQAGQREDASQGRAQGTSERDLVTVG
jgi:hypothetical protein